MTGSQSAWRTRTARRSTSPARCRTSAASMRRGRVADCSCGRAAPSARKQVDERLRQDGRGPCAHPQPSPRRGAVAPRHVHARNRRDAAARGNRRAVGRDRRGLDVEGGTLAVCRDDPRPDARRLPKLGQGSLHRPFGFRGRGSRGVGFDVDDDGRRSRSQEQVLEPAAVCVQDLGVALDSTSQTPSRQRMPAAPLLQLDLDAPDHAHPR